MEKSFIFKHRFELYLYGISAVIGIVLVCLLLNERKQEWYEFIKETVSNFKIEKKYKELLKYLLKTNAKKIIIIFFIINSHYKQWLSGFLAVFYGISFGFLATVIFNSGKKLYLLFYILLHIVHIAAMGFAAYLLYVKKRKTKYPLALVFIVILSMFEALIYNTIH